ncbi:kinase [Paramagnetospirillum magneticum]|uniref:Predicted kinase n=1 Tax=Paramagnetospirillum magneticum (strain ATCC 700264 / AMB-1) TaxID=342108 RepID=Q2W8E8_PARM1|nr:kinase [Paramagnetospirillum magneticum]BAE49877.1 Predicted kinase [Paramagnetospirillum magneticum AMB-1]
MIISRTPFRVSLFGGGSDYPKWYREHGGQVLGFAINKYCYLSVRPLPPFFEHKHRIVYAKIETVNEISEIQHPAVRHILDQMGVSIGLEIHHDGDLPARSGLGSSSSFTVGMLNALRALEGRMSSKEELARQAIHIEQNVIAEAVGSQDQIWAAYGGLNHITFQRDDSFEVTPVIMDPRRQRKFTDNLILFFTGFSRFAAVIAEKKIANLDRKTSHLRSMVDMVDEAKSILTNKERDLDEIGRLLHESWRLKRDLADDVSTPAIDEIYESALAAGALGGKLLGAGGGGFMLFYVAKEQQDSVRKALSRLIEVQFDIDYSGSKIVVYEPKGLECD